MADEGAPAPGGGGGSVFTRRLGPAPVWLWMAGLLGAALAVSSYRKNKQSQQAQPKTATTQAGTPVDQIPPFIIQNFQPTPPPGPAGPQGPPGAPATPVGGGPGVPVHPLPIPHPLPPPAPVPPPPPPPVPPVIPQPPRPTPPPAPAPPPPAPREPLEYRVKPGDTITSIAQRYGTTWQAIWYYNLDPANGRSQDAINKLKQRGPNLLYSNELLLIPQ